MENIAFALKYRPQNFNEVVGQKHIVSALKNAILKNRVHHAYLFSGPRGVGKTSLARIFAKALNCIEGPTVNPCGKCISCISITKGTSLDVIEIDGASNRGIDEIRTLREAVKLSPANSRYKIYIIDEVHMLTQEAFNALLKTLEEPPSHVKFIFATTLPQKVLPTILSRCQKFQFKLLTFEEIISKLERIIKEENLKIDKNILHSIARSADGSIRDAESLLDQITPIILEKGEIKDVISFLGIIDETTLNNMLECIAERNIEKSLDFIQKITQEGKDLGIFLSSFIEHLRSVLLSKISIKTFKEIKDISPYTKEFIIKISESFTTFDILRIMDLLIEGKDLSKKLNSVRIPLELAIIKFITNFSKDDRESAGKKIHHPKESSSYGIEAKGYEIKAKREESDKRTTEGENKNTSLNLHPSSQNPSFSSKKDTENLLELALQNDFDFDLDDIDKEEETQKDSLPSEESLSQEDNSSLTIEEVSNKWPEIISEISKERVSLASYLKEASIYSLKNQILTLAFLPKYKFHKEVLENIKNIKFIKSYLVKSLGCNIGIKCIILKEEDTPKDIENSESVSQKKETDIFINELLDTFGGNIHTDGE